MFHLEQSITAWREQMLAAGIGSPVPLEELEAHLREEIDRQLQAGLSESEAFHAAVQNLGPAVPLKTEFTKTAGFWNWFGDNNFTRTNRILGTVLLLQYGWLLFCAVFFLFFPSPEIKKLESNPGTTSVMWIASPVLILMSLFFIGASISLIRGGKTGRGIIRFAAWLDLASFGWHLVTMWPFSTWDYIYTAFAILTLWLLYSPKYGNPKPAN